MQIPVTRSALRRHGESRVQPLDVGQKEMFDVSASMQVLTIVTAVLPVVMVLDLVRDVRAVDERDRAPATTSGARLVWDHAIMDRTADQDQAERLAQAMRRRSPSLRVTCQPSRQNHGSTADD